MVMEERRPEMIWLSAALTGGAVAAFGFSRGPLPSLPEPADRYADNEDLQEAERRAREGEVD